MVQTTASKKAKEMRNKSEVVYESAQPQPYKSNRRRKSKTWTMRGNYKKMARDSFKLFFKSRFTEQWTFFHSETIKKGYIIPSNNFYW